MTEPELPTFDEPNEDDIADESDTTPEVDVSTLPPDVPDGDIGASEPEEPNHG